MAAAVLGGGAVVILPVDGAVVSLEAVVLVVAVMEGLVVAVVGLDVVDAGRAVEGAVAGLVLEAAATRLAVVEVLGFGAVDAAGLLAVAVVFGLVRLTVSATGFFLGVPFTVDVVVVVLVPFVTVAAATEVVLGGPTGFFSGTLVWFLTEVETATAAPNGLLGTAPAADAAAAFAAVVAAVFLAAAAETL